MGLRPVVSADLKHFYVNQPNPDREGMKRLPQHWCKPLTASVLVQHGAAVVSRAGTALFSPLPGQKRKVSSLSEDKQ